MQHGVPQDSAADRSTTPQRVKRAARVLGSLGLLAAALIFVDLPEVADRLRSLNAGWVAVALAVTVLQTVASAWRWRFTASQLGIPITMGAATREYYLAAFLNQVVPGGVVGDVSRAVRHARDRSDNRAGIRSDNRAHIRSDNPADNGAHIRSNNGAHNGAPGRRAIHAVVIERLSGQMIVVVAALVSAGALIGAASERADRVVGRAASSAAGSATGTAAGAAIALLAVAVIGALFINTVRRRVAPASDEQPFRRDLRSGLLAPRVFKVQLLSSLAIVASYVVTYLLAARAIAVETSALTLLPLVMPVLLSMLLPISIAGWGVREAAAGAIWGATGLAAADGVAISLAYGLVVLVGTLPGAAMLAWAALGVRSRREGPDQIADRGRAAGDEPADGVPPPATQSLGV